MKEFAISLTTAIIVCVIYNIYFNDNSCILEDIKNTKRSIVVMNDIVIDNNNIVKQNNELIKETNDKIDTLIQLNKEIIELQKQSQSSSSTMFDSVLDKLDVLLDWFHFN